MGSSYNAVNILLYYTILLNRNAYINSYVGNTSMVCKIDKFALFGKKNRIIPTNITSGKQEHKCIKQKPYGTHMQIHGNPDFKNYDEAIKTFRARVAMSGRGEILSNRPERHIPRHMILRKLRQTRGYKISAYQKKCAIERATKIDNNNNIRNVFRRQLPCILTALDAYQQFLEKNHGGSESFLVTPSQVANN